MIQSGEAELVQGQVASVGDGKLTVTTADGQQKSVTVTADTKFPGAGANGGASQLSQGQQVTVLARKATVGADGKALLIRVGQALKGVK